MSLKIVDLFVSIEQKPIIKGLNLEIKPGEVHTIMGPNGSGKSTLANTLMGHPKYSIVQGRIELNGQDITELPADKRARAGLFLSMQHVPEIPGVTVTNFLRIAKESLTGQKQHPVTFYKELQVKMSELGISPDFAQRYINVGFSGGEKKRLETLQLAVLDPVYAILDETDSGLDVDALKAVAEGINRFRNNTKGVLLITHYNRILEYVRPDYVHIMKAGQIVESGGEELAKLVEKKGYQ